MAQIATSKSFCINIWQSWEFKPTNFRTETRLL